MSTGTAPEAPAAQPLEPDTVELHVRNVPRAVWLKARHAALASRLRFGQYVIKLLEQAGPLPASPSATAEAPDLPPARRPAQSCDGMPAAEGPGRRPEGPSETWD